MIKKIIILSLLLHLTIINISAQPTMEEMAEVIRTEAISTEDHPLPTGTGTAAKFNVVDKDETTILSGSVSTSGGGGDMIIDNTSIASGQNVSVSSFTYIALSS